MSTTFSKLFQLVLRLARGGTRFVSWGIRSHRKMTPRGDSIAIN